MSVLSSSSSSSSSAAAGARGARRTDRRTLAARIGLVLVAGAQAEIGVWGLVAPSSFYRSFPGGGHHWVGALGAYNEHLVRDYAAAELGLTVLLLGAAIWFSRPLVLVAGAAFLAATVPHFIYHLTTTSAFSTEDNLGSLAGFVLELVLVGMGMWVVSPRPAAELRERSS